ncbi:hypothetical protein CDV36_016303 [Fusarium kuroshium]|uniref:FAD-binding domain-containing protein n=1 Tax=Fusarium kuroshium TaxID=2010991 RepID=A0A3M2QUB1_9HYPO|nr:hypothetical protein CDV36_016303 [Fusarium kuroshium]
MSLSDLGAHLSKERYAGLHWIVQPDRTIFPGVVAHLRAVRPWNEWVMIAFGPGGTNPFEGLTADSQELIDLVRHLVGDESIDDAYNLAWKVAYVSKGLAGTSLLDSYSKERQPVGSNLVRDSNNQIRKNTNIWDVLGMAASSTDEGMKQLAELSQATPEGSARRARLYDALEEKTQEFESLGLAYNQWYTSAAVYLEDEPRPRPLLEGDPVVEVQISTYPGSRLPHVWIDSPTRQKMISTIDLAGKGSFCLFVGVHGNGWRAAAEKVKSLTGIPINVYGIGPGQEWIDIYRDWHKKRGVDEDGCVLVRSDRFVAWRSFGKVQDYEQKLAHVLGTILSRDEL